MKSPITGKEMKLSIRDEIILYQEKSYNIKYIYYIDEEGNEFTNEELDNINITQVYYQAKYYI